VGAKKGCAPVVFEGDFFAEDLLRAGEAGTKAAEEARKNFERDGVANETLQLCEAEGTDGTELPHCVKVYLPAPAGKFGMVLQLEVVEKRSQLRYLAFGVRHQPKGSTQMLRPSLAAQRHQIVMLARSG
jgi:hypothetical protein